MTTTLAGTTNYLLRFPQTLEKVSREARSAFRTEADINLTTLGQLPYLSAIIEEGLRIISPVPLGMPRVVPRGGDSVCGEWLPEDMSCSSPTCCAPLQLTEVCPQDLCIEPVSPSPPTQPRSDQSAGWIVVKLLHHHLRLTDGMPASRFRWACVPALVRNLLFLS